jgi:chromosome segregation ATPase
MAPGEIGMAEGPGVEMADFRQLRNKVDDILSFMESVKVELREVRKRGDEILDRQKQANGSVARHDLWIAAKDVEFEQVQDRLDADDDRHKDIEEALAEAKTYMDERRTAFEEHKQMQGSIASLGQRVDGHDLVLKASAAESQGRKGLKDEIAVWCAIATPILAALIGGWLAIKH